MLKMSEPQVRFWTAAPGPTVTCLIAASTTCASMIGIKWWTDQLTVEAAIGILIGAWLPAALYLVLRYVFRKKKETGVSLRRTADGPGPNGDRAD